MKKQEYFKTEYFILNDNMLQDLKVETLTKYHFVYQSDMPETTIVKYVYKAHNEVFCNQVQIERPKCKCVFTLHTGKKSSWVQLFNYKSENIYEGNSLWSNKSIEISS